MKKPERIARLAATVAERGVLHLTEAASLLGVSMMTVRRDIADAPGQFAYLGGHIVAASGRESEAPYDLSAATDKHRAAKRAACRHAASLIRDDDTIFLDCGSTMVHLADLIPQSMSITVVCYALNIADRLARHSHIRLILLGGVYHPSSASFSGNSGSEELSQIGINKAFISAAGLDLSQGATCAHFHESPVKRQAIARAQSSYLVIDSSKIGQVKASRFADIADFEAILTENGPFEPVPPDIAPAKT
ncbi:MAG: hypothetical protein RIR97_1258 [Pseudomonadota bacterium]